MKTTTIEATPRPWRTNGTAIEAQDYELPNLHVQLASIVDDNDEDWRANAALIVRAVNSHDELVAALQDALDFCQLNDNGTQGHLDRIVRCKAALRNARGEV